MSCSGMSIQRNLRFEELKPSYSSWAVTFENFVYNSRRVELDRKPEVNPDKVVDQSENNSQLIESDDGGNLFLALRLPLVFGVLQGLIPIRGIFFGRMHDQLQFSWFHWRTIVTALITFCIGCNIVFITDPFIKILTDTQRQTAGDLVYAFSGVWFYAVGTSIYLFFLIRSGQLRNYFEKWAKVSKIISATIIPDAKIRRDVNLITLIVIGSCAGENLMFHFHKMSPAHRARMGVVSAGEFLADFYESNKYMYTFFDYNPAIALALFVINKLSLYAWNFGDVILMVLCRAIYGRFEGLNLYLERSMTCEGNGGIMIKRNTVCWKSIRLNFLSLVDLLEDANQIFGPLVWISYITDIFFVCNQLYIQLSPSAPSESLVSSIYVVWSFMHLILATLSVNMLAAKINESAHRIVHLLQHCHAEEYDKNVLRLEQYLQTHEIGLTGNGCFVITRSFILTICSAIFTLEVVLLQSSDVVV